MSRTRYGMRSWKPWNGSPTLADEGTTPRSIARKPRAGREILAPPRNHARGRAWPPRSRPCLDQALVHHRVGHLEEAGDVRAVDEVPRRSVLLRGLVGVLVDRDHDLVQ